MSRSALARSAQLHAMRNQSQEEQEDESQRRVKNDELPIHGNETTYNLNTLLHQNIMQSPYFRELYKFKTYHEVVDEIYYRVDHAEPFAPGTARMPSTCFCLLFKCFTMRLTVKQMNGMLKHMDSPYIRAVGFLYLRYVGDPEQLWSWFEPYIDDDEEFNASANPHDKTTIGKWLKMLLEENNYFGTILPRIPKKIQDSIKVRLLLQDRRKEREKANLALVEHLKPGTKIRAMYADEDNEPAVYDAVIDSVEDDNTFWVSFPEYGNTEKLGLGDIELDRSKIASKRSGHSQSTSRQRTRSASRSRSRGRDRDRRGSRSRRDDDSSRRRRSRSRSRESSRRHSRRGSSRSRSRDRGSRRRSRSASPRASALSKSGGGGGNLTDNLLVQVREEERRKAAAVGKDYAARPASYKGSLSLKLDRYTTRKQSPTKRTEPPPSERRALPPPSDMESTRSKPAKISRDAQERMRLLRQRYGDASTANAGEDDD